MDASETVRSEVGEDGVSVVRLCRAAKRNAVDIALAEALASACEAAEADDRVGCLLIAGEGQSFCAGIDFHAFAALFAEPGGLEQAFARIPGAFARIEALAVPVVAALHGAVLGAGLELALAADVRIAARGARLGLPEVRVGMVPDLGGIGRLVDVVGHAAASRLVLGAEDLDADGALALGLVSEVVSPDDLLPRARAVAARIASHPRRATREAKRLLRAAADLPASRRREGEVAAQKALLSDPDHLGVVLGSLLAGRGRRGG